MNKSCCGCKWLFGSFTQPPCSQCSRLSDLDDNWEAKDEMSRL